MKNWKTFVLALLMLGSAAASAGSLLHKASFDETYNRYPSTFAVVEQFRRIVPAPLGSTDHCYAIDDKSAAVIGAIDPMQNGPLEKEPGDLFYQFFQDCVTGLVSGTLGGLGDFVDANTSIILGDELNKELNENLTTGCLPDGSYREANICDSGTDSIQRQAWNRLPWKSLPASMRQKLLSRYTLYLVGPEVILRSLKYIGTDNVFGANLNSSDDLVQFLDTILQGLPDLSLSQAYAQIAILLRLGPAIKS